MSGLRDDPSGPSRIVGSAGGPKGRMMVPDNQRERESILCLGVGLLETQKPCYDYLISENAVKY